MEFKILYCQPCGYRDRADELATELIERFGACVAVEEGRFGQFDVLLDGELVASKGGFWKRKLIHGPPPQPELHHIHLLLESEKRDCGAASAVPA